MVIETSNNGGENAQDEILAMRTVSDKIKEVEIGLRKIINGIEKEIYFVPNIVHSSVPEGKDASANIVIKKSGKIPEFAFIPKDHLVYGIKWLDHD